MNSRNKPVSADNDTVSVGFVSLGCAKNLVDLQVMASSLVDSGVTLAHSAEEADIILVNTCSFIEDAREEAASEIIWACDRKKQGLCRAVVVTGCLPQRYRARMLSSFPDVDAILGVDDLDKLPSIIEKIRNGGSGINEVSTSVPKRLFTASRQDLVLTGGPFAYLKLGEGCNHACAYCAIPGIRGKRRSRNPDILVSEAAKLISAGYREIDVIAQDTTSYGKDLPGSPSLASLLKDIDSLAGDFWIRILYGYPGGVSDELLSVMASGRHICKYIDIPVQHSHPDILRAMRRADTIPHVENMTSRLRSAVPGITVRTTFLLGFPGETVDHFNHLMNYASEERFDHAGAFAFSPEEDTAAYDMGDDPDDIVAEERRDEFMRRQSCISDALLAEKTGKEDIVLLEQPYFDDNGKKTKLWSARAQSQAPEELDGVTLVSGVAKNAEPGSFIRVQYTGVRDYDLLAKVL